MINPKLRDALDVIQGFLLDPAIGGELADVLSALRGPDSDDMQMKIRTTNHIRRAAFPEMEKPLITGIVDGTALRRWDLWVEGPMNITHPIHNQSPHFLSHIRRAREALGQDPETGLDLTR